MFIASAQTPQEEFVIGSELGVFLFQSMLDSKPGDFVTLEDVANAPAACNKILRAENPKLDPAMYKTAITRIVPGTPSEDLAQKVMQKISLQVQPSE